MTDDFMIEAPVCSTNTTASGWVDDLHQRIGKTLKAEPVAWTAHFAEQPGRDMLVRMFFHPEDEEEPIAHYGLKRRLMQFHYDDFCKMTGGGTDGVHLLVLSTNLCEFVELIRDRAEDL